MAWSTNLIHKSGPRKSENGTRTTYEYEFLCPTALLDESKPYPGEPCPDDEAAICKTVFSESVSPTFSRIVATYRKGWTITFGGDGEVGDETESGGTVQTAEEDAQGNTIRKPHVTWVDEWVAGSMDSGDQARIRANMGTTNASIFRNEAAGKWQSMNWDWETVGSADQPKYLTHVVYEHNPDGWDTTLYSPSNWGEGVR